MNQINFSQFLRALDILRGDVGGRSYIFNHGIFWYVFCPGFRLCEL